MTCRFGCSDANPAVVVVALSRGCLCYPDDTEQALCLHHTLRATPRGTLTVTRLLTASPFVRDLLVARGHPEVATLLPDTTGS